MATRTLVSLPALLLLVLSAPASADDTSAEQARKTVWAFESKLLSRALDGDNAKKEDKERDAQIRDFFSGLKTSELKIEAIAMMDSRYVYVIPRHLTAELLGKLLDDADARVRNRATRAVGYNHLGERFADKLFAMLKDKDADTRKAGLSGLGHNQSDRMLTQLRVLLDDPDPSLRVIAVHLLGRFPLEKVEKDFQALLKHPDEKMQAAALEALARHVGDIRGMSPDELLSFLDDPRPLVRFAAIELAGRRRDVLVVQKMVQLLKDDSSQVRYRALIALGRLGDKDQADAVAPLLSDKDVVVRRYAVETFGTLGTPEHAAKLLPLLKDEDNQVRERAARVLSSWKASEAADGLRELLGDKDVNVRLEAIKALMFMDAKKHVEAIAIGLAHEHESVRAVTIQAIRLSKDRSFTKHLEEIAKNDPSPFVRDAARYALSVLKE